jgi:hypothetical protein
MRYDETQENIFVFHAKSRWKVVRNSKDRPTGVRRCTPIIR